MMKTLNNIFTFGEIGDRLDGVRSSEVYKQGLKDITNFIITDIGSLKALRKYDIKTLSNFSSGEITLSCKETALGYTIILTNKNIFRLDDNTNTIVQTISHSFGNNAKITLVGNDNLVIYNGSKNFEAYNIGSTITKNDNLFKEFKFPVKEKEVLQLDLWKVSKNPLYTGDPQKDPPGTKPLRIIQMSAFTDPLLKSNGGKIYLHNSDILINRIYTSYNAAVDIEYFNDPKEGEIYGIMRTFPQIKENGQSFIIGESKVTLGSLTNDTKYKGSYFTSITGDGEGIFTFGKLIDNIKTASHISFFQDRLFLFKDDYFYVSKIGEYNNFRNGINSDNPFFFQLNPISGRASKLVDTISDIGLFVLTTAGIYIIGYGGSQLTPTTFGQSIVIASDMGVSKEHCIKDNVLYFINTNDVLCAVFIDRLSQQVAFNTIIVDKYTSKRLFKEVTRLTVFNRDYVACRSKDDKYIYLIEPLDEGGIFRKVKFELDTTNFGKLIGVRDKIISNDKIIVQSNKNFIKCSFEMLKPNFDSYLFDYSSRYEDIILKTLNEDREAINGVKINDYPITNLPNYVDDLFSIYRRKLSSSIYKGIKIEILTKQNDKNLEVQGIETYLSESKSN